MKKTPLKLRILLGIGLLCICSSLLLNAILGQSHADFLKGFLIGLGIVLEIAAVIKIGMWRKAVVKSTE